MKAREKTNSGIGKSREVIENGAPGEITPGILPFALRAGQRPFKFALWRMHRCREAQGCERAASRRICRTEFEPHNEPVIIKKPQKKVVFLLWRARRD
jgi:hypothetical protein